MKPQPAPVPRLASIDAYRGFVMFLMMAEVLHLAAVAKKLPESDLWRLLAYHQTHVEWVGCSLHDLIQPGFSFLVGVALPFSIASRWARGRSYGLMTLHAFWRAFLLVILGVWLRSVNRSQTYYTFEDTLSQIGLGYPFLFLLGFCLRKVQWGALVLILVGYSAAFFAYPAPPSDFHYAAVGADPAHFKEHFTGLAAHWNKNSNLAWAFDQWFLNLFPREKPFTHNGDGYATLSFIPTLATMILGLLAGGVLQSERTAEDKVRWLGLAGVIALAAGYGLGWAGIVPVVKRIWTPSWVLFSGGWSLLLMAAFYGVIDALGWRGWSFPLRVIGMNSIAAYVMAHLFDNFIGKGLYTHLGREVFRHFGDAYEPFLHGAAVLLVLWLILLWMERRRILIRI